MKGEKIEIIVDRKKKKYSKKKKNSKKKKYSKKKSMCRRKKGSRNQKKSSGCGKKKGSRNQRKISSRSYKKICSCKQRNCIHNRKRSPKHLKKVGQKFPTKINSNLSINQHVVPYKNKDINQKISVGKDLYIVVSDFHVPLHFLDVDYNKENYDNTRIYHFGDVVTIKNPRTGELLDYVNLVSDIIGIVGQNPLKDKIAWLKIRINRINRLNGASRNKLL